jgi:hypothetical protein
MLTTPATYRIVVQGQVGQEWSAWFGGLSLSWQEPDQTVLVGQVVDQAALHGLLNTIRDLGLPLLEMLRLPEEVSL